MGSTVERSPSHMATEVLEVPKSRPKRTARDCPTSRGVRPGLARCAPPYESTQRDDAPDRLDHREWPRAGEPAIDGGRNKGTPVSRTRDQASRRIHDREQASRRIHDPAL